MEVVESDAGIADRYLGSVPAGLAMLVGIFGNIPDRDIERSVVSVPMLCRPGGTVIWTRSRRSRRDAGEQPAPRGCWDRAPLRSSSEPKWRNGRRDGLKHR
jgi:hypothetical protein